MKWKPDWSDIAENLLIGLIVVVTAGAVILLCVCIWKDVTTEKTIITRNGNQSYACTISDISPTPYDCKPIEDTKKSSASGFLPHGMGLHVELDTNETCYLKSGWKEHCGYIYGLAVSYTDGSGIVSVSRPDNPVPIAIMNSHVRLAVSFDEHGTETTK